MRTHRNAACALIALILAACQAGPTIDTNATDNQNDVAAAPSPTPVATGLSSSEEENIRRDLMHRLLQMRAQVLGGIGPLCTTTFSLGEPKIVDASLAEYTGKLRLAVPVTGSTPVDRGQYLAPRFYFPTPCYGEPAGGWSQGQTAMTTYVVNIEKWQSGWRMAQDQNLVPAD